ncbi:MAG: hypothetical protein M0Q27_03275, partial [Candidatus Colwellbacteria bacterium]|nr:hypothetical protein [Candidatus Colwellbacteria bacterium]
QKQFLAMCRLKPEIVFDTMLWTFQVKQRFSKHKHLPFILWSIQRPAVQRIVHGIRFGGDLLMDKSREMGATWILLGAFLVEWLLNPDTTLMVISRKEEYVWKKGNPDTLFWKLEYMLKRLPLWVMPKYTMPERHLENLDNGSVIDGESTNADVGAGGRRAAIMCDEFSRVNFADAQNIADTISDTTECRIFNSTPTSRGHPFGQLRFSGTIEVYALPWWEHPDKIEGAYESPNLDEIIIHDIAYYRKRWPDIFVDIRPGKPFRYSQWEQHLLLRFADREDLESLRFVANGNDPADRRYFSPTGRRSPWYDEQCDRRTPRDKATNIDMDYIGAGDVVFNPLVLRQMLDKYARPPVVEGEIGFSVINDTISGIQFTPHFGRRRLKWWTPLAGARPDQLHNYIVGCDISMGTGQSNSVACIYDCNLHTKVGRWTCPNTPPTHFAEVVVALCRWVGGASGTPFLLWEGPGPGQTFGKRVWQLGYDFIYYTREEKGVRRKRKNSVGWYPSGDNKLNLLVELDAAYDAVFRKDMGQMAFINPDAKALREAEDYIFYTEKSGIGPSQCQSDEGGAAAAHGDCVIADALCCLGRRDQQQALLNQAAFQQMGSFIYRRRLHEIEQKKKRENGLWLL